ncbi:MAG: hypothetical protein ACTSQI_05830 [Candidatus Helarchaeota archaeon]
MDKAELKEFAKQIMDELNLTGGKISKLIQRLAPNYDYDKNQIKVQVKRVLIGQY